MPNLVEIGPLVLEKKIFKISQCIFAITWLSSLYRKVWGPSFVELNPWPKDALCQIWLKLAHWFWRRRFLKFVNIFSLFLNKYLSLQKGRAFQLYILESSWLKDTLCQVWLKLAEWFWRGKCKKFTMTTTMTNNEQIVIRKAHLSLRLRWAKNIDLL